MSTHSAEKLGCNNFCSVGSVLDELSVGSPDRTTLDNAKTYVDEHPCRFIVEGNCRLAEFFLRRALGLSTDEHYHESPRMKENSGRK